jgi:hypothetical protein
MGMALGYCVLKTIKLDPLEPVEECNRPYVLKGFERGLLKKERKLSVCLEYDSIFQMSYSGYNHFRSILCKSFLNKADETVFNEWYNAPLESKYPNGLYYLINFADNEGYIGPTAVKEIAKYFDDCNKRDTLKKKKEKFKKMDKEFYPYLLTLIKMVKVAASKNAYLQIS